MALDLIDRFRGPFEPEKYEDTYRSALLSVIERKRKGKEVHVEPQAEREAPTDLLEALRASVEAHSRNGRRLARTQRLARRPDEGRARQARAQGRHRGPLDDDEERARRGARGLAPQIVSGTISIAPHGHSATQIPQPLQKS